MGLPVTREATNHKLQQTKFGEANKPEFLYSTKINSCNLWPKVIIGYAYFDFYRTSILLLQIYKEGSKLITKAKYMHPVAFGLLDVEQKIHQINLLIVDSQFFA